MNNKPIKFGTDGWRAVIAREYTFENVKVCAQAVAEYMSLSGLAERGLVIGYDTRFASEDFAAAAASVVAANGIKVMLSPHAVPTPVVSFGILTEKAGGAIIITASHNPATWNGFKIKTKDGAGAPDEVTARIEGNIDVILNGGEVKEIPLAEAEEKGLLEYVDLASGYYAQINKLIDLAALRTSGLKIVVDSMYGAGSGYIRSLLEGGNVEVTEIHGERNPAFPGLRPEPIMPNVAELAQKVVELGADVGIATDGDADRVGIVDEKGNFISTLQVMSLLALYLLDERGERGTIVKTITTSAMLDRLGELYGVPVKETHVGFKYIAPIMMTEHVVIGGEESGGYGFHGHAPERDGVLAALYFLDFMARTGKSPSQLLDFLFEKVGPHHFNRVDIEFPAPERETIIGRVSGDPPQDIEGVKVVKFDTGDGYRFTLEDGTWLLVRFSGTEPLLRVYAESDSPERVARLIEYGRKLAGV